MKPEIKTIYIYLLTRDLDKYYHSKIYKETFDKISYYFNRDFLRFGLTNTFEFPKVIIKMLCG